MFATNFGSNLSTAKSLAEKDTSWFPVQVGEPTKYAKDMRRVLVIILIVQVILTVTRCIFSLDIIGALFMAAQVAVGYVAWVQDMNVTYVTVFGVICFFTGIFSTIMAIIPIIFDAITLQLGAIIASCLLPIANFAGAYLARLVYQDWLEEKIRRENAPDSTMFGSFGSFAAPAAIANMGSMFTGKGHTLGAGEANPFLTQPTNALAQAQAGAASYLASGQQAVAGYAAAIPAGKYNVKSDPFMLPSR